MSAPISQIIQASVSDEDVLRYELIRRHDKEYVHGQLAIEAARIRGIFSSFDERWNIGDEKDVIVATSDVDSMLCEWQQQLEQSSLASVEVNLDADEMPYHHNHPTVTPISNLRENRSNPTAGKDVDEGIEKVKSTDVKDLKDDQRRAFDIVDWHLKETIEGKKPPQLLMMIPGEGGVGKSKLIQTITQNFQEKDVGDWCMKGAYTGIAASLMGRRCMY